MAFRIKAKTRAQARTTREEVTGDLVIRTTVQEMQDLIFGTIVDSSASARGTRVPKSPGPVLFASSRDAMGSGSTMSVGLCSVRPGAGKSSWVCEVALSVSGSLVFLRVDVALRVEDVEGMVDGCLRRGSRSSSHSSSFNSLVLFDIKGMPVIASDEGQEQRQRVEMGGHDAPSRSRECQAKGGQKRWHIQPPRSQVMPDSSNTPERIHKVSITHIVLPDFF
jgi:hypothetical protein